MLLRYICTCLLFLLPVSAAAEEVYQKPEAFIKEAFGGVTPAPAVLKVGDALQKNINDIMQHNYPLARVRYWAKGAKSAWILEEIGKVLPITVGILVEGEAISTLKVLIYRESHGWEVKHDFFTEQFIGKTLKNNKKLSGYIDGISGATLSVNALKKLGALALLLDKARMQKGT